MLHTVFTLLLEYFLNNFLCKRDTFHHLSHSKMKNLIYSRTFLVTFSIKGCFSLLGFSFSFSYCLAFSFDFLSFLVDSTFFLRLFSFCFVMASFSGESVYIANLRVFLLFSLSHFWQRFYILKCDY